MCPILILKSSSPYESPHPTGHYGAGSSYDQDYCGRADSSQQHLVIDLHEHNGHCQSGWDDWQERWWHPDHWCPLITTKPIVIPLFGCKQVKRLMESLPVCCYWVHVIKELIENHWLTWGVMAISTYSDLYPGSRRVGIMLQNLTAWEVRIPPKTIIGNVQLAEMSPIWPLSLPVRSFLQRSKKNHQRSASLPAQIPPKWVWPSWTLYLHSWNWMFQPWSVMCCTQWISQRVPNGTLRTIRKQGKF